MQTCQGRVAERYIDVTLPPVKLRQQLHRLEVTLLRTGNVLVELVDARDVGEVDQQVGVGLPEREQH